MSAPPTPDKSRVEEIDVELLKELERRSLDQVRKLRRHDRVEVRVPVRLHPANPSDHEGRVILGVTHDLSRGGCRATLRAAPRAGDIYRLNIEIERGTSPLIFARCLRTKLVREDAFDAAFSVFSPLDMPGDEGQSEEEVDDLFV